MSQIDRANHQNFTISGQVFNWLESKFSARKLNIVQGRIVSIEPTDETNLPILIPGFRNAHNHIESTKLPPPEAARILIAHGTDAMVSDPHELANVLGPQGVKFMLRQSIRKPKHFREPPVYFSIGIPSCVPASPLENSGAIMDQHIVAEMLQNPRVRYLAEMMNYPGVLSGDAEVHDKLQAAHQLKKLIDGHAPQVFGTDAERYFAYGITTDHECTSQDEALGKLKCPSVKIIIRDGSAARNFDALAGLIDKFPGRIMFGTDDLEPEDLVKGDILPIVRKALAAGCDVANVMQAACIVPVEHYQLPRGCLRLGDRADFNVVDDLRNFNILKTYVKGRLVAENGRALFEPIPVRPVNKFLAKPINQSQVQVPASGARIRVIEALDGELITNSVVLDAKIDAGFAVSDPQRDILKIVVVNRYQEAAQPTVGFIRNFGLRRGAIASTVMHDSHNIIAVGVDDRDIVKAINTIISKKGGQTAVCGDEVLILPLNIGGLMSTMPAEEVAKLTTALTQRAIAYGSTLRAPFMTLSFMGLSVIPRLKLTDVGLIDVEKFEPVSIWAT